MDLVSCRNLLIYMETNLQAAIIPAFHYSLLPEGICCLAVPNPPLSDMRTCLSHWTRRPAYSSDVRVAESLPLNLNVKNPDMRRAALVRWRRPNYVAIAKPLPRWHRATINHLSLAALTKQALLPRRPAQTIQKRLSNHARPGSGRENLQMSDWNSNFATQEQLQSLTEQHQTALEELRSANEELHSVNEEMQSTNEELETSKEELQSLNEELQTVNVRLIRKSERAGCDQ